MFFGPSFNGQKCKAQLKMASIRIAQQTNKKTQLIKGLKREIAQLLADNKEEKARIRTEHIIREDFVMEAYETISLLCELLHERMPLIQSLKLCPPDLQESVVTVIYAAARTEIPELMKVRKMFKAKYGDKFVERALMNENRIVNDRIVNKLGINPPNSFLVLQYMKEIAKAHNVEWDHEEAIPEQSLSNPMPAPTGFSIKSGTGGGMEQVYGQQIVPNDDDGQVTQNRVQCGNCKAILAVPINVPRFACSNCGALLASPTYKAPVVNTSFIDGKPAVPVINGQYLNQDIPNLKHVDGKPVNLPNNDNNNSSSLPSAPSSSNGQNSGQKTITITVPLNFKSGHKMKLKLQNGEEMEIDIPDDVKPGSTIQVSIPGDNDSSNNDNDNNNNNNNNNGGGGGNSGGGGGGDNDEKAKAINVSPSTTLEAPKVESQKSDDSVPDFDELAARFAALKK